MAKYTVTVLHYHDDQIDDDMALNIIKERLMPIDIFFSCSKEKKFYCACYIILFLKLQRNQINEIPINWSFAVFEMSLYFTTWEFEDII